MGRFACARGTIPCGFLMMTVTQVIHQGNMSSGVFVVHSLRRVIVDILAKVWGKEIGTLTCLGDMSMIHMPHIYCLWHGYGMGWSLLWYV